MRPKAELRPSSQKILVLVVHYDDALTGVQLGHGQSGDIFGLYLPFEENRTNKNNKYKVSGYVTINFLYFENNEGGVHTYTCSTLVLSLVNSRVHMCVE